MLLDSVLAIQENNHTSQNSSKNGRISFASALIWKTIQYIPISNDNRNLHFLKEGIKLLMDDLFKSSEIENIFKNSDFSLLQNSRFIETVSIEREYQKIMMEYLNANGLGSKQLGAFHTPKDVLGALINSSISIWEFDKEKLSQFSVIDPTMGGGDWLTYWFKYLLYINAVCRKKLSQKIKLFAHTIHGVDIDPIAVLCARLTFWSYLDFFIDAIPIIKKNLILEDILGIFYKRLPFKMQCFDIVIGNPPYVVKNLEKINSFTNKANNLFAAVTEGSIKLLKPGGAMCFILPLSISCSKNLRSLRQLINESFSDVYYSCYGIRPQSMFPRVDQRITVLIGKTKKQPKESTSYYSVNGYLHWKEREELILALNSLNKRACNVQVNNKDNVWPKITEQLEVDILRKIIPKNNESSLLCLLSNKKSKYPIYFYGNARYFIKAIDYRPFYKNKFDKDKLNSEVKVIFANDLQSQKTLIAVMNSTVFFWIWVLFSDCFHVDHKLLSYFRINPNIKYIADFSEKIISGMKLSSITKEHNGNLITEFNMKEVFQEILTIDCCIFKSYCFSNAEAKYISSFCNKFRYPLNESVEEVKW